MSLDRLYLIELIMCRSFRMLIKELKQHGCGIEGSVISTLSLWEKNLEADGCWSSWLENSIKYMSRLHLDIFASYTT